MISFVHRPNCSQCSFSDFLSPSIFVWIQSTLNYGIFIINVIFKYLFKIKTQNKNCIEQSMSVTLRRISTFPPCSILTIALHNSSFHSYSNEICNLINSFNHTTKCFLHKLKIWDIIINKGSNLWQKSLALAPHLNISKRSLFNTIWEIDSHAYLSFFLILYGHRFNPQFHLKWKSNNEEAFDCFVNNLNII